MCARFTLRTPAAILAKMFEIAWESGFEARSNIVPTNSIYVVRCGDEGCEVASLKWSLLPAWAKSADFVPQPINATAEKLNSSGMFKQSFRRRRCLVPVDGWYEWKAITSKIKERYFFRVPQQACFALAGIWDRWTSRSPSGESITIDSCAIVTTVANELVGAIHDKRRMPVILRPEDYGLWLDHSIDDPACLLPLLRPFPDEEMEAILVPRTIENDWFDARCWPHLVS